MIETPQKKTVYELGFLLAPGKDSSELKKILAGFGMAITKEGEIKNVELAYEIEKQSSALFGFYYLDIPEPESIEALTNALNLRKDLVLRFLLIKLPKAAYEENPRGRGVGEDSSETVPVKKPLRVVPESGVTEPVSNESLEESLEEILK